MYKSQVDRLCVCVLVRKTGKPAPQTPSKQILAHSWTNTYESLNETGKMTAEGRTPSLLSFRFKAHQTHQSKTTKLAHRKHRDFIPNIANR
jgi:hypothetical protein